LADEETTDDVLPERESLLAKEVRRVSRRVSCRASLADACN